jgi:Ca-activated chloride channel family protein
MDLVRFEHSEVLYALFVLLVLVLVFVSRMLWARKMMKKIGDQQLVMKLMKNRPRYKYQVKFILYSLALASLILALANLQFGSKVEKMKRKGIDLVIALDLSKSMLAEDITPNRLERSRQFIYRLIDKLEGDRVGIIVFAGNAYVQMPLTVDHTAAKMFLSNVKTSLLPTQGTAIGDAIDLSLEMFESGDKKHRTLLIISDGENHEGDAIESAKNAGKEGVIIHSVGIGTLKGGPIPVYVNGIQVDYKRDHENSIVLSKLNEQMLQEVAAHANGEYFRITNSGDDLRDIIKQINKQEEKEYDAKVVTDYKSQFQLFLLLALLFLLVDFFIFERKSKLSFSFKSLRLSRDDQNLN